MSNGFNKITPDEERRVRAMLDSDLPGYEGGRIYGPVEVVPAGRLPCCRVCAWEIPTGQPTIRFQFTAPGHPGSARHAYMHLEPCREKEEQRGDWPLKTAEVDGQRVEPLSWLTQDGDTLAIKDRL